MESEKWGLFAINKSFFLLFFWKTQFKKSELLFKMKFSAKTDLNIMNLIMITRYIFLEQIWSKN